MRTRRGHTLVEVLVAITLFGVTLSTIGLTLHTMARSERQVAVALDADRELERLTVQLRQDAHQATSASTADVGEQTPPQSVLSFVLPDEETVQYTLQSGRIERVLRHQQTVRHRETYRLPAAAVGRWQVQTERPVPMVSLVLDLAQANSSMPIGAGTCRVDAAVQLFPPHAPPSKP